MSYQPSAPPRSPWRWAWWGGLLGLAFVLVWVASSWLTTPDGAVSQPAAPVFTEWNFNPFASGPPLEHVQQNADAAREADAARLRVTKVWESGSLRGSNLDGAWGAVVDGQLQPSLALRQRFDYLLTALGEVAPADLREWIAQEVTTEMDASAAHQVLTVWDRYIALQHKSFSTQANPNDAATWQPALAERTAARRQMLGNDWAQAFYADEERSFVAFTDRLATGAKGVDAQAALLMASAQIQSTEQSEQLQVQRVKQFGAEAAERLRAEDAQWADWERRLQTARMRLQAIAAAPELSAPQRSQAQAAYLAENFSGSELVRAQALLGVDH